MKQIAVFTMGTRGDIQPYLYLAQALGEAGHRVVLGTHPCWKQMIEQAGVSFAPIGPDVDIQLEAAVIRGKVKNPALSMLRTMNFVFRIIQDSTDDILRVCRGKDLILVSHSQMGAVEAKVLGIPTVNVTLQVEMIPQTLKKQRLGEKLLGRLISSQMVKPYNKIGSNYGLAKFKSSDEVMSQSLDLIPLSPLVTQPSPWWEPQHIMTGYWYRDEADYQPPQELLSFLQAGEKPVILALGAMSFESRQEREKLDCFVRAFEKTGMRAIIQGFEKTLEDYELPHTMMAVGSVPHSWLFMQGSFVIHHCGFGTACASLLYGIPSIPVPHVLDQFGFAQKLYELGVSTQPLKVKALSAQRVAEAVEDMKQSYHQRKMRVMQLRERLRAEQGLQTAVKLIEEVLAKGPDRPVRPRGIQENQT